MIFPSVHLASFLQCILDHTLTSSLVAQTVKRLPTVWETQGQSLGWEDLLEKETATQSSILAWKIPWMEEPGGLQSIESNRVGHDWVTSLSLGHTLQLYFAFSLFGCAGLSWDMRGYSVAACGIQRLTRDWTQASCTGSMEAQPPDHQGRPSAWCFKLNLQHIETVEFWETVWTTRGLQIKKVPFAKKVDTN